MKSPHPFTYFEIGPGSRRTASELPHADVIAAQLALRGVARLRWLVIRCTLVLWPNSVHVLESVRSTAWWQYASAGASVVSPTQVKQKKRSGVMNCYFLFWVRSLRCAHLGALTDVPSLRCAHLGALIEMRSVSCVHLGAPT